MFTVYLYPGFRTFGPCDSFDTAFECGKLFCVMCVMCVLCLIVVSLPPGKNPFAVTCKINIKIINTNRNKI
jgi:hypothetical protein